jgi:hypothetical protein
MGTGSPYKVLEAAASGAAVVATPWAAQSFGLPGTDGGAEDLARRTVELLDDEAVRAEQVRAGLAVARRHRGDQLARRLGELLQDAASSATRAVGRHLPVG